MDDIYRIGVYKITCGAYTYIGSTGVSFYKRWKAHESFLRLQTHPNKFLQSCYNKYGAAFSILELCHADSLDSREQYYMDFYRQQGSMLCNHRPSSKSNLGIKYGPEFREKCRNKAIRMPSTAAMNAAKSKLGYVESQAAAISKTYRNFVSPEGVLYESITNLHRFSKERNLDSSQMVKVYNGKRNHHKGWTIL